MKERFTVKQHIPPGYHELRWCIFRDGKYFCDRNDWKDADRMARLMNKLDRQKPAELGAVA